MLQSCSASPTLIDLLLDLQFLGMCQSGVSLILNGLGFWRVCSNKLISFSYFHSFHLCTLFTLIFFIIQFSGET